MRGNQRRVPEAWLITDVRLGDVRGVARRLPRGTGVLVRQHELAPAERRALLRDLRRIAAGRGLVLVDEAEGLGARVHDARELRRALLRRAWPIFLSPVFETRTHPGWRAMPRMRAAALVRLARREVLALGGMDARRFEGVRALGVAGWGAIDGWIKRTKGPSREWIP